MKRYLLMGAAAAALTASVANAATLSNGTGDGTVTVAVDGFGSFGSSIGAGVTDAFFDPVGEIPAAGTTFESAIAVSFGGVRPFLTTGSIEGAPNPSNDLAIVSSGDASLVSTFSVGALDFRLEQTLVSSFDEDGSRVGSALNQVYTITNAADVANSFDVVRYLDGDLDFDGSISDGGGRIFQSGNEILFETDSASTGAASTTFVGITANGGEAPEENRFEISPFSELRGRVSAGGDLTDEVFNDFGNDVIFPEIDFDPEIDGPFFPDDLPIPEVGEGVAGDGFIDVAFDVTLALRNEFELAAGETAVYSTTTLFGNAVPPAPGSLEALPLLPAEIDEQGAFVFIIGPDDFDLDETFFIDPVIAIGYTYEITGGDFDSVTAPSFAAVADPDGYTLDYLRSDGTAISILIGSGETVDFTEGGLFAGVTEFTISGIDQSLGLDPDDQTAFVTGVSLGTVTGGPITILQTPIEFDTGPTAVPLPPSALLLGFAVLAFGAMRRRAA